MIFYKNGSTQNQYIDAILFLVFSVDCENHEETELVNLFFFVELKKESNEYIAQGIHNIFLIINWFIVPIIKKLYGVSLLIYWIFR
mgnify:CR=1 FL=1